jgi:hypothetical protein
MPDFMSLKPRKQVAAWCRVMVNKFSPLMEPKGSLLLLQSITNETFVSLLLHTSIL